MTKTIAGLLCIAAIIWALVLAARMMGAPASAQAAAFAETNTEYHTPTFIPTETPIPTSTIGYEATLFIAQATADEARRVNAEVTAQAEQRILSYVQMTADTDKRNQEVLSWTAIAGPTVIPLTATQQAIYNTQAAESRSMVIALMTGTARAPTHIAAMARSYATVQYAQVSQVADLFGKGAIVLFCIGVFVFGVRQKPITPRPVIEQPRETVVHIRRENGQGDFNQARAVVPCTPEQLTELAEYAVNGEKKFGINRLETQSRTFKSQRETLIQVRQFLIDNCLVITDANGTITLNDDGEAFLEGWFDTHRLPTEYEFEEQDEPRDENYSYPANR